MHIAYVDESGDAGLAGSHTYALGCVLVDVALWPDAFDGLIAYRRFVRDRFGVRVRDEIKANYLIRNAGPFKRRPLSEEARHAIYRQSMRLHAKLGLRTFGVVIHKGRLEARRPAADPRDVAWEYLIQRLERFSTEGPVPADPRPEPTILVHDEGDAARVRKLARKARRAGTAGSAFGTGNLKRPARLLIDDPVPRNSTHSYFLQLADLAAFAAFRRLHPPPARQVIIVPQMMWDELGNARYTEVHSLVGGVPGIVYWPRP